MKEEIWYTSEKLRNLKLPSEPEHKFSQTEKHGGLNVDSLRRGLAHTSWLSFPLIQKIKKQRNSKPLGSETGIFRSDEEEKADAISQTRY